MRTITSAGLKPEVHLERSLYERVQRVRAVESGRGLNSLLGDFSRILKNPILMISAQGALLARSDDISTDDHIWNDLTVNGEMTWETRRTFRDEGFFDEMANTKTIALLVSDKLKYDRLVGMMLTSDGIPFAGLMATTIKAPFEYGDALVFEAICERLEKELRDLPDTVAYGREYQQSMIVTLLDSLSIDKSMYPARFEGLYPSREQGLLVAVAQPPEPLDGEALTDLREQLRRFAPGLKYAVYEGRIVVLLGAGGTAAGTDKPHRLLRLLEQRNITVGVSERFENIYELRRHYDEAVLMCFAKNA